LIDAIYVGDLEPRELRTCVILAQFRNADGSLVPRPAERQFYQDFTGMASQDDVSGLPIEALSAGDRVRVTFR
jgi:hypothetical protein